MKRRNDEALRNPSAALLFPISRFVRRSARGRFFRIALAVVLCAPAFGDESGIAFFASSEVDAAFPTAERRATLEEEFYDALWRGGALQATPRSDAQAELATRFPEWEPLSSDLRFLTNGEISPKSKATFEAAEDDYFNAVYDRACREVRQTLALDAPSPEGETRRAVVTIRLPDRVRVVYLTPNFATFAPRDPESGEIWRPRARRASAEIIPEPNDATVEVETLLERAASPVSGEEGAAPAESGDLAFAALVGFDLRPAAIPFAPPRVDARSPESRLRPAPKSLRFGALTCFDAKADASASGKLTVTLRFQYDFAADAFDSHRQWLSRDDFRLATRDSEGVARLLPPESLRFYARNEFGGTLALAFRLPDDYAPDDEFALIWLAPRFWGFVGTGDDGGL